jgi:hypothetical protein
MFSAIVEDGRLLTSVRGAGDGRSAFHLMDLDTRTVASFGPPTTYEAGGAGIPIAYGGGTAFWSGRALPAAPGYQLERRSLKGEVMQTVTRLASWMRERHAAGITRYEQPFVSAMTVDREGNVLVATTSPSAGWRPARTAADRMAKATFYDIHVDVISPGGELLAAVGPIPADTAIAAMPFRFLDGRGIGYRQVETESGVAVAMSSLRLGFTKTRH